MVHLLVDDDGLGKTALVSVEEACAQSDERLFIASLDVKALPDANPYVAYDVGSVWLV